MRLIKNMFRGRLSRKEYLLPVLLGIVPISLIFALPDLTINILLDDLNTLIGNFSTNIFNFSSGIFTDNFAENVLSSLYFLQILVLPYTIRRLHDIGWSRWLAVLTIIPILILFIPIGLSFIPFEYHDLLELIIRNFILPISPIFILILLLVPGAKKVNAHGSPPHIFLRSLLKKSVLRVIPLFLSIFLLIFAINFSYSLHSELSKREFKEHTSVIGVIVNSSSGPYLILRSLGGGRDSCSTLVESETAVQTRRSSDVLTVEIGKCYEYHGDPQICFFEIRPYERRYYGKSKEVPIKHPEKLTRVVLTLGGKENHYRFIQLGSGAYDMEPFETEHLDPERMNVLIFPADTEHSFDSHFFASKTEILFKDYHIKRKTKTRSDMLEELYHAIDNNDKDVVYFFVKQLDGLTVDVAEKLINTETPEGHWHEKYWYKSQITTYIDNFDQSHHLEIAQVLIDAGYANEVIESIENFDAAQRAAIAQILINAGHTQKANLLEYTE